MNYYHKVDLIFWLTVVYNVCGGLKMWSRDPSAKTTQIVESCWAIYSLSTATAKT